RACAGPASPRPDAQRAQDLVDMGSLGRGPNFLGDRRGVPQDRLRSGRVAFGRVGAREARARPDRFDAHPQSVRPVDGFLKRGTIPPPPSAEGRSGPERAPGWTVAPPRRVLTPPAPRQSLASVAMAHR